MDENKENRYSKEHTRIQRKKRYRELLRKVEDLYVSEEKNIDAAVKVGKILEKANVLRNTNHDVEELQYCKDETVLDSMVISSTSSFFLKIIEDVCMSSKVYNSSEFAAKLKKKLCGNDGYKSENLLRLKVNDMIHDIPQFCFIHGTFEANVIPQPKQRNISQRQKPENDIKKKLKESSQDDKNEEDVNETVKVLYRFLRKEYKNNGGTCINYYDFLIDSDSFEKTIENMFYFAFLLRDGKAALEIDENNVPKIMPMSKEELNVFRDKGGVNLQMICSIDMDKWKQLAIKEGIVEKYKKSHA